MILFLLSFPFLISFAEKFIIKPALSFFPLSAPHSFFLSVSVTSLLLLIWTAFSGQSGGLEINKKSGKWISLMFILLLGSSFLFLYSLLQKSLFDSFAVIYLFNLIILVFREEFVLRGIVQTQAGYITKGKSFNLAHSIWISTFSFSLWHLINLAYFPIPVVIYQMIVCIPGGIILGIIKEKTDNTLLTYLIHINMDLLSLSIYLLIFGKPFFPLF